MTTYANPSSCCKVPLAFEQICGTLVTRVQAGKQLFSCRCMACGRSYETPKRPAQPGWAEQDYARKQGHR